MPFLLTMSLFGSIGTLFYIILLPLAKKYLSIKWRRVYLIINILEYLLPLPYCNSLYADLLRSVFRGSLSKQPETISEYTNVTGEVVQFSSKGIWIPDIVVYMLTAGVVITGIILFCRQIFEYQKMKEYIKYDTEEIVSNVYDRVIQKCISKCKLRRPVRICLCSHMDTPFTIGVMRPVIAFPDIDWTESDLSFALTHEITHIKQHDNLIKILSLIVIALNFYNPLAYFVLFQWNKVAELSCDSKVLAGKTTEEVKEYGLLIIRMAESHSDNNKLPVMGFNMQKNIMKERIYQMKKETKKGNMVKRLMGAGVMGVVLFTSSLSVFAYSPKNVMHQDNIADEIVFCDESTEVSDDTYENLLASKSDGCVFISEDGTIVEAVDESDIEAEPYVLCIHAYVSGELAMHYSNSDGSCKIEYYSAQRCSKCGKLIRGDLVRTTTFTKCSH